MAKKIVDIHAHAFDDKIAEKATDNLENYYGIHPVTSGHLGDLLKKAESFGVTHLVVCASATKPSQVEKLNDYIHAHISDRISGFGSLHPAYENPQKELARMKQLGIKGVKFHPIFQGFAVDDPAAMNLYDCIDPSMPILMHLGDKNSDGSSPWRMANVIKSFPHHTFICAHLGGVFEWEDARKYIIGKNVYIDTSSAVRFLPPKEAKEMILQHDPDKILFGTDYPLSDYKTEFSYLNELELSDELYEKIYGENACRLLGI